jgi:predicted dehydrogenase
MKPLKIALIGCGRIWKKHIDVLSGPLREVFEIAAICDVQAERAESAARQLGVPAFTESTQALTQVEWDLAAILTESGMHAEHIINLSKFGKPLIVEKPLALNINDAEAALTECEGRGVRLFVVKQNRFNPPVHLARKVFEEGHLGDILQGGIRLRWRRGPEYFSQDSWRGTWKLDGGVVGNQAAHHVDLMAWFLGNPRKSFALGRKSIPTIEAVDGAVGCVEFDSGVIGSVDLTTATSPRDLEGAFWLLGTKGTFEISGLTLNEMRVWEFEDESLQLLVNDLSRVNRSKDLYGVGHVSFYRHVADCLSSGKTSMLEGKDSLKTVRLIESLNRAIRENRVISSSSR